MKTSFLQSHFCALVILFCSTPLVQAQTSVPATQPAEQRNRIFRSMPEVLANVPAELRPKADPGWYKDTQSKFAAWVQEQMVGMELENKLPFNGCTATQIAAEDWTVAGFNMPSQYFTYANAEHRWRMTPMVIHHLDEATARKWEHLQKETLLSIKGIVQSVSVASENFNTRNLPKLVFAVELRDVKILPPEK